MAINIQPGMFVTFVYGDCDHNGDPIYNVTLRGTNGIVIQASMDFMGESHTSLNLQLADTAHLNLSRKNWSHTSKVNIDQTHCQFKIYRLILIS